jgi:HEAT repeat protein
MLISRCRWSTACIGILLVCQVAQAVAPPVSDPDVIFLRSRGIAADTTRLLGFLRDRTPDDRDFTRIESLVQQLGASEFEQREDAGRRLVRLESRAVSVLKRGLQETDPEIRRRARNCLRAIEGRTSPDTVRAIMRVLRNRGEVAALGALLAYLPSTTDEEVIEEIYYALVEMTEQRVTEKVVGALSDKQWQGRAVAALAVGRNGDEKQRRSVKRLLADREPEVRLRAAQGLLAGQNVTGLLTLSALLEGTPLVVAWQAEELLRYAAGLSAPVEVIGLGNPGERKACRRAWEGWVRKHGAKVDLTRGLRFHYRPSLVLIFARESVEVEPGSAENKPGPETEEVQISVCGGDGSPRRLAFSRIEDGLGLIPKVNRRQIATTGRGSCLWFYQLGLLPDLLRNLKRYQDTPTRSLRSVARPGSRTRVMVDRSGGPGMPRLIEVDQQGKLVQEAICTKVAGAIVFCPLVRVGYPTRGTKVPDLATPDSRARLLRHPVVLVRRFAAETLYKLPRTAEVFREARRALEDPDAEVCRSATFLFVSGGQAARDCIPKIMPLLNDERKAMPAVSVLATCGEAGARALVVAFENREDPGARTRRLYALGGIARIAGEYPDLLARTIKAAARDPNPALRRTLARELAREREGTRRFLPEFLQLLAGRDERVINEALKSIHPRGPLAQAAIPTLIKLLQRDGTRDNSIYLLGGCGFGNDHVFRGLLKQTSTRSPSTQATLAIALGNLATRKNVKQILPVLKRYLREEHRQQAEKIMVQEATMEAVSEMGSLASPLVADLLALAKQRGAWKGCGRKVLQALKAIDAKAAESLQSWLESRRV